MEFGALRLLRDRLVAQPTAVHWLSSGKLARPVEVELRFTHQPSFVFITLFHIDSVLGPPSSIEFEDPAVEYTHYGRERIHQPKDH